MGETDTSTGGRYRIVGEVAAGAPSVMTDWMDPDVYGTPEEVTEFGFYGWSNLRIEWEQDTGRGQEDAR